MLSFKEYLEEEINSWLLDESAYAPFHQPEISSFGQTRSRTRRTPEPTSEPSSNDTSSKNGPPLSLIGLAGLGAYGIYRIIKRAVDNSKDKDHLIVLSKYKDDIKNKQKFLYQSKTKDPDHSTKYEKQIETLSDVVSKIEKDIKDIKSKINEK